MFRDEEPRVGRGKERDFKVVEFDGDFARKRGQNQDGDGCGRGGGKFELAGVRRGGVHVREVYRVGRNDDDNDDDR